MNAEILCIGTEVLIGDIVNTNAAYIAKRLSEAGVNVYYHTVCGDNTERISECLDIALNRSDIVITTGGLGPTYDDITKEIVAHKLGKKLVLDMSVLNRIENYFVKSNRTMTENNKKQAYIPEGAHIFENMFGTADGIAVNHTNKTVIMLPGPPREMKPMLDNQVLPYLSLKSEHVLVSSNVNIFGIGESAVEEALSDLMKNSVNPTVAPYVGNGELRLRVTSRAENEKKAKELISPVIKQIKEVLGKYVYGVDCASLEQVLVDNLLEKKLTVAFAESCTGGLISKRITDIPGSSAVFGFGMCTYANQAKMKLLSVKEDTLKKYGAVSEETAIEMAQGALMVSGADIAVSVTGIAGPTGGTETKPVGLVYLGIATKKGSLKHKKLLLCQHRVADREFVRILASNNALMAAIDECREL